MASSRSLHVVSSKAKKDKAVFFNHLDHLGQSDCDDNNEDVDMIDEGSDIYHVYDKTNKDIETSAITRTATKQVLSLQRQVMPKPAEPVPISEEDIETESEDEEVAARRALLPVRSPTFKPPVIVDLTESDDEIQVIEKPLSFDRTRGCSRRMLKTSGRSRKPRLATSNTVPEVSSTNFNTTGVGLRPKATTSKPAPKPRVPRKPKKSKDDIEMVAEKDRIFNGLTFFFIPNNDVHPTRRSRIRAGIARGALWTRLYDSDVTHVLVDYAIPRIEAAKAFPNWIIPPSARLMTDTWLVEAIKYEYLPDPSSSRFQLIEPKTIPQKRSPDPREAPARRPKRARRMSSTPPRTPPRYAETEDADELSAIINEVQTQNLPLDIDSTTSMSAVGSFGDDFVKDSFPKENRGFLCMEKNDGNGSNANARTIEILQQMASFYDRTGDNWRTLAYRKAISALRKQDTLIATREQALAIPQIGSRLADKIEEIVTTNRLRRLEYVESDPDDQVLKLFMGIYDVGHKQASQWITQGYRTLEDLRLKANLSANQKVGIDHYDDFQQRIPRAEVAKHGEIVKAALFQADDQIEATIGGSYRRGDADSGDIDLIITKPNASLDEIRTIMHKTVIPNLQSSGFLKVALASSSGDRNSSKWHGASCLPNSTTWRRIDLLFVPWNEVGAALIYFTGNDIFNRSMRLLASRKGMRLNHRGLYADVMRGEGKVKVADGRLVEEGASEMRIFELLGVPWREPRERIC